MLSVGRCEDLCVMEWVNRPASSTALQRPESGAIWTLGALGLLPKRRVVDGQPAPRSSTAEIETRCNLDQRRRNFVWRQNEINIV